MSTILRLPDKSVMDIVRQLRVGYGLKRTLRYNTWRDHLVHSESVAEHVFALDYLADYFLQVEVFPLSPDEVRVRRIIRYHDFPEIKYGDKPYHLKTPEDEERERSAAAEVFAGLPEPMRELAHDSWREYEAGKTLEARFVIALDKVEPMFELLDPVNERSIKRTKQTYRDHTQKKLLVTKGFPVMRRFVDVMSADMLERGVFYADQAAE